MRRIASIIFTIIGGTVAGCGHTGRSTPEPIISSPPAIPVITEQQLGTTPQGRPMSMIRFGTGSPVVIVMAGIHGDERTSCDVADQIVLLLRSSPELLGGGSVAIIPRANPDGYAAKTRSNSHGVDLNRNFPASNWALTKQGIYFGGSAPESEPETAALVRIIRELRPSRIISIHSIARGGECNNYDGPAGEIARAMSRSNHYPAKATMGYPTPGSLGSWAGIDQKIAVITLELPRDLSGEQAWQANREAVLAAIRPEQ